MPLVMRLIAYAIERLTIGEAGYVTKTSLVPALKFTKEPELLEARTVVRARVVPADVYVPIPTSHSEPV